MRNDARPVGEDSPASPVGGDATPGGTVPDDRRDSHKHDRQSHVVNRGAEHHESEIPPDPGRPRRRS
jgi:hypothetical protein